MVYRCCFQYVNSHKIHNFVSIDIALYGFQEKQSNVWCKSLLTIYCLWENKPLTNCVKLWQNTKCKVFCYITPLHWGPSSFPKQSVSTLISLGCLEFFRNFFWNLLHPPNMEFNRITEFIGGLLVLPPPQAGNPMPFQANECPVSS